MLLIQPTVDLPGIFLMILHLDPNEAPVEPVAGDKFQISTLKSFKTGDMFSYSTLPVQVDKSMAKDNLSRIDVVPNPYLGAATWEKRNLNSSGRGERKIDFINLPAQCTVRIYTITGALIKTLSKDSGFSDGSIILGSCYRRWYGCCIRSISLSCGCSGSR